MSPPPFKRILKSGALINSLHEFSETLASITAATSSYVVAVRAGRDSERAASYGRRVSLSRLSARSGAMRIPDHAQREHQGRRDALRSRSRDRCRGTSVRRGIGDARRTRDRPKARSVDAGRRPIRKHRTEVALGIVSAIGKPWQRGRAANTIAIFDSISISTPADRARRSSIRRED